ncbi:hypothetical protein [Micromonospora sp. RTGN7]|uniref:hypothetical protein n=1 Tax=Micromonospora sp. RTGN7 TaxID=3016526 RepID=UPI0029FF21A7|nr:hypothetical protein [Micromonospora sp. RTGN7]
MKIPGMPPAELADLNRVQDRITFVYLERCVPGEQRLSFEVHDHHWEPADFDGITLMRRPTERSSYNPALSRGWSKASKRRRFGRRTSEGTGGSPTNPERSEGNSGS